MNGHVRDDLRQAIALLTAERAEAKERLETIDRALDSLRLLVGGSGNGGRTRKSGESLYNLTVDLVSTSDQAWTASEVLSALRDRGVPIVAKDPANAVRTAMARAAKAGTIQRVGEGRYAPPGWDEFLGPVTDEEEAVQGPDQDSTSDYSGLGTDEEPF
jgi:hypothetical protein